MKLRALALLGVLLLIGACTPMEYYQAPPRATEQTAATITGSRTNFLGLVRGVEASITHIDGKSAPVRSYDQSFLVAPGRHRVRMIANEGPLEAIALVDFEFQAGRSYVVRASDLENTPPEIWLEDARTGQIVARRFSADLRSASPPRS
jgi:hypothetical protein